MGTVVGCRRFAAPHRPNRQKEPAFGRFFSLKQTHLTGLRHAGEGAQRLQLLDVGLTELVAGHGELLDGDELLALALLHGGQRRRLAQTVH